MRVLSLASFRVLLSLWLVVSASVAWAHEIPRRVGVQAYVRADGRLVRVLVRVPMDAMRDVEFPQRGGVLLDIARADSTLRDAAKLWVFDALTLEANGRLLTNARIAAVRASLPSDRAFESYESANATVYGARLADSIDVPTQQAMLDVAIEVPLPDALSSAANGAPRLAIALRVANLGVRTTTVLRLVTNEGAVRAFVYDGDAGLVQLEPAWWHAAVRFVREGMLHLFGGLDHLLFLLCLVLPVRRIRALVGVVTAFTLAHSITLAASAVGFAPDAAWFPPLVEVLIAASIVYMAIENVIGAKLEHRWLVAFGFGLIHGFGFSFALRDALQFAGPHLITALAAFNIGIEIAQLVVVAIAAPLLAWAFARLVPERAGVIVGSVLVGHSAWHWMTDRFELLQRYPFSWPAFDAVFAVGAMRLGIVALVVVGVAWGVSGVMRKLARGAPAVPIAMLMVAMLITLPSRVRAQAYPKTTMGGVYTADQAVKGKEVFQGTCSGCHTVASHSGPVFAARWMGKPLSEFYDYVSRLMPKSAPGTLSEDEYVWVTAYVLKLNGFPPSKRELTPELSILKTIRIDTTLAGAARAGGDTRSHVDRHF